MKTDTPHGHGGAATVLALLCLGGWLAWRHHAWARQTDQPLWLGLALPAALAGCAALGYLLRRAVRARRAAEAALEHSEARCEARYEARHRQLMDAARERSAPVGADATLAVVNQALLTAHAELENRIGLRTAELLDANLRLRAEIEVRKTAEQALADSEARLQEIFAMMPVALCLKDHASRIVMMNPACEQQWGAAFAQLEGRLGIDHFPAQQLNKFLADDQTAFAQRSLVAHEELVWNGRLRENRMVQTYKKPTFHGDGRPHQLILLGIDVTERRLAEETLRHSFLQLRELSDHQETIKDQERRRIALDIHDDLGQNLMALKIDIGMLHARTGTRQPRLHRQIGRVLDTIDATIRSVRNIINDLHPSTLELGLCAAVEWLLKQFGRHGGIAYTLVVLDDSAVADMDKRQTLAIFRIIQESLANIVRHAQASEVRVSLNLALSGITIVIADNGIGMQPGDRGKAASFGLKSIKERIAAFGGELSIDSRAGCGTALSILMPAGASCGKAPQVASPPRMPA
ncbi:MAG: histidine kinase [Pseudomonadota bacterium]